MQPDGSARLRADPNHKLPFPTVSHGEEWLHIWREVTAPVLWMVATESRIKAWATANEQDWHRRMAAFRDLRLETIEDAGHMVHHDQPERVAALIEAYGLETRHGVSARLEKRVRNPQLRPLAPPTAV